MKKRTKILLIAGIALLSIVVILCFTGVLGIQTLYLPVKVEITFANTETGSSFRTRFIEYSYGSNGRLEEVRFRGYPDGILSVTCNINGNVTALDANNVIFLSDDLVTLPHFAYRYSATGQLLTSRLFYSASNVWTQTENTYSIRGLLTRSIYTDQFNSRKLVTTTEYTYNLFGKCVSADSHTVLNDEPRASTHTEYKYDAVGRLIQENCYNESNILTCQVEYRYENGNTIASKTDFANEQPSQTTYIFDHAGNLIEQCYGANGQIVERYSYTYLKVFHFGLPRNNFSILTSLPETGIATSNISSHSNYDPF